MNKQQEIVLETQYWKIVLIPNQLYLGRSVLVLKRPCGDLADLSQTEVLDFFELVKKLQNALKLAFGATMFNWECLMNNAYLSNPAKPQVHWHFRARYKNTVEFGGQEFSDPNFGHHPINDEDGKMLVPRELLGEISKEIQKFT